MGSFGFFNFDKYISAENCQYIKCICDVHFY